MKPIYRPALSAILVASWVALAGADEKRATHKRNMTSG